MIWRKRPLIFKPDPKARANFSAGTLYAIDGEAGWIYYGQHGLDRTIACFHLRTAELEVPAGMLDLDVMCRITIQRWSIGDALRRGMWRILGRYSVHESLATPRLTVQWPVGTLTVTVWRGGEALYDTRVEDPDIQDLEIMATYEAGHLPERLASDFGVEPAAWYVGGPVWRERRVHEEYAKRFPDQPWHLLPSDWVPTDR